MRDQYVGDVSDVIKCAFLRSLAGDDRSLGIAWYYVPVDDGRPDGRHLEWRDEPAWRTLDEEVHSALSRLPERNLTALERASFWPRGTLFHSTPMPRNRERDGWSTHKRNWLKAANLVFLDPDTGVGAKTSSRHASFDEIRNLRMQGRAIVFISFPGRHKSHDDQLAHLHQNLAEKTGTQEVLTLRTSVSIPRSSGSRSPVPRPRWFTIVDSDERLAERARSFRQALLALPRLTARLDHYMVKTR